MTEPVTVKGILPYRLGCAASFIAAGLVLLIDGISSIQAGQRPFAALLELVLSSIAFSLSVRCLVSRADVSSTEIRLHSMWRTARINSSRVTGVERARFFGWDVLALTLDDGSSVRLPMLTQPGDPERLRRYEVLVEAALAGRSSPTDL